MESPAHDIQPRIFRHEPGNFVFALTVAEYDKPFFGNATGELRFVDGTTSGEQQSFSSLSEYLRSQHISVCTYRGPEDVPVLRLLEDTGFRFVQTLFHSECGHETYRAVRGHDRFNVRPAVPNEYDNIACIEGSVFDYSTFQVDTEIPKAVGFERNRAKARAYLADPNQATLVLPVENRIASFVMFVVDRAASAAQAVAGGAHPDFHGRLAGPIVISRGFRWMLDTGIERIAVSYSGQNRPIASLLLACGFQVRSHELHYRLFLR